jgi:hypothetical protein
MGTAFSTGLNKDGTGGAKSQYLIGVKFLREILPSKYFFIITISFYHGTVHLTPAKKQVDA